MVKSKLENTEIPFEDNDLYIEVETEHFPDGTVRVKKYYREWKALVIDYDKEGNVVFTGKRENLVNPVFFKNVGTIREFTNEMRREIAKRNAMAFYNTDDEWAVEELYRFL